MIKELKEFAASGNVIDLAVGIVIGVALLSAGLAGLGTVPRTEAQQATVRDVVEGYKQVWSSLST